MHECSSRVLTSSKDCTVAVTALGMPGGTLCTLRSYEELHEGVVK